MDTILESSNDNAEGGVMNCIHCCVKDLILYRHVALGSQRNCQEQAQN